MHQPLIPNSHLHADINPGFAYMLASYEDFYIKTRERIFALVFLDDATLESLKLHKSRSLDDYNYFLNYHLAFQKAFIEKNHKVFQELGEGFLADIRKESPEDKTSLTAFRALVDQRNQELTEVKRRTQLALTYFRLQTYAH